MKVISNFRFLLLYLFSHLFLRNKKTNYEYSLPIPINSRVIIYGAGEYGKHALNDLFFKAKIIDILDQKRNNLPRKLNHESYDYIVLSVMTVNARVKIFSYFKELNVPPQKIIYMYYS